MSIEEKRIVNLDLFRALAIILVIYYHVTQMVLAGQKLNPKVFLWGKFGVEFFFVLSGFLVGGLYYKQKKPINLFKFWLLRIFRTYPPYVIGLAAAFVSVFVVRGQPFDFGYLFFLQNFYHKIPYFLVSWSLCVEEHFYLMFPFMILISESLLKKKTFKIIFWILIALLPTFYRWKFGNPTNEDFGFYKTATLFRFDGIAMGCLLAFLIYRIKIKLHFSTFQKVAVLAMVILSLAANVIYEKTIWSYYFGYTILNFSLFLLLALFYFGKDFTTKKNGLIFSVASMAYSIYLTHALTINLVMKVTFSHHLAPYIIYVTTVISIFIIGYIFYNLIEKPTIRLRNTILNKKKVSTLDRLPVAFGDEGKRKP